MKRKKMSNAERREIYNKCKGHCAYCGCELEYRDMQVDHVIPLRRGGADDIENMLPELHKGQIRNRKMEWKGGRQWIEY